MKNKLFTNTFILGLTVVLGIGLAGCNKNSSTAGGQVETQNTEKESDLAEGGVVKIVVAHTQAYAPYDFVDDDGNSDGYEVAVMKAIDELLPQYEFEYVGTTDDDLLIGVESGKYDVGTKGVWWTQARTETYIFPQHYIGSSIIGIAFRSEDADEITDLESFAAYSGNLVPIAPQNAQYQIVVNYNESHPDNQIDLQASDQFGVADAYQWVLEGRYDAYFNIKTSYDASVISEDGEYHELADRLSYIEYEGIPTWPLFNKENQELADAYDEAWEQLEADGTLEELAQQYFGYSLLDYIPEGYQKGDDL